MKYIRIIRITVVILIIFATLLLSQRTNTETYTNFLASVFGTPSPKIYVLTRTSGRPKFFNNCKKSIKTQTYKNWEHIISCDDPKSCEYAFDLDKTTVVPVNRVEKKGKMNCPYNMYNNNLIKRVPHGSWMLFLDDDGKLYDDKALARLCAAIKKSEKQGKDIIISLGDGKVNSKPKCWGMTTEQILAKMKNDWHFAKIDTSHFCIKNAPHMALWRYKCAGDAHFFHDNLKVGYEPYYNEDHVISGNYMKYGGGNRKDII